ncbi:MAG: NifB/NifX family molybdenum-iron cluster-binding protein [Thermotogaceae bacterium]|nr:NifB/NifX family molybdenum-iron cluster-binding protein [Thermotogaceae bacterium]
MIIAIPVETDEGMNSMIAEHFGRTPYYAFVKVEGGEIVSMEVEPNPLPEHAAGELPAYMHKRNVDVLIVRGIGQKALRYLNEYGIQVIRGAQGTVENVVKNFIQGQLNDTEYEPAEHFHNPKFQGE